MVSMKIEIEGMSCGHCVGAVRKALGQVDGVIVEEVTVGSATVTYDAEKTSVDAVSKAVEKAGYAVVGESTNTRS
jgi:copper chaperone